MAAGLLGSPARVATVHRPAASLVAAAQPGSRLLVGVGRADITPVTGVYKGGWACTCARAVGQWSRLHARAVVLREGSREVALVAMDLAFLDDGMVRDAIALDRGLGFSDANVIVGATHTHGSQSGYMNFTSYNSILPSTPTQQGENNPGNLSLASVVNTATNQVMYNFMTRQLALAIRRAVHDLHPGKLGWGYTQLLGVTQNRSLGAHLANFGITNEGPNAGSVSQDPGGYADTIDPAVNVLRVDQTLTVRHVRWVRRGPRRVRVVQRLLRDVPVGIFSTFANHGTLVKEPFLYYSADHQGEAERMVEAAIRRAGHTPQSQDVVNAFANSDAGDMTSGIKYSGPADAEYVGVQEGQAMLAAWRQAGRHMSSDPILGAQVHYMWTRTCWCGQDGTDTTPWIGQAAGAGSEEGRTIFYYEGLANEGDRLPIMVGPQGDKVPVLDEKGSVPQAIPFNVMQIGDHLLASIAGEPTIGVGKMLRAAIGAAVAGHGINRIVIVGYANGYNDYFTTPAEYEMQAYEGGFTMYGKNSSFLLRDTLVDLARRLVTGQPAPAPYPYDPNQGVHVTAAAYGNGVATGTITSQPQATRRLGHTTFGWTGGANGIDRPVDRAFVTMQRRVGRRWVFATNDLGLQIAWLSDASGHYSANWEPLISTPTGTYRFRITAKRYALVSRPFTVLPEVTLTPVILGATVILTYPKAVENVDWDYRPADAIGGAITFLVGGHRRVTVQERSSTTFPVPAGASVIIPAGAAHDRYGNRNAQALRVR
ncbi:MAG TPA: neutral/alkaline non-lysosomal ceramidase N-terminal domain-containing protein [Solirubrobacteraceae bacterium]|nr:neutral/alkaline non-lysosomal ceramidase N-terminal domain-containing protein [Solirubrobacteraceae bacterium]